MRKISFKLLTQAQLEVLETSARTLGELKAEISRNQRLRGKIAFGEVQLIERETKATFGDIDDAILPATDCIMFVVPRKTKSGAPDLASMSYTALKAEAQRLMDDVVDLEEEKILKIIRKIEKDPEEFATKQTELDLWIKIIKI